MKSIILLSIISTLSANLYCQDRFFKTDAGIGAALTVGSLKSYGLSGSAEPKFFFNPKFSVGLRFEGSVLFGGKIDNETGNFDLGVSSRAATLLKGEYYLTDNDNRLFLGLMLGRYVQANIGSSSTGSASISAGKYFGFAPELGITFTNFRISGIYHLVPGTDLITVATGNPVKVSRNYFVIQMGFRVFQID
jgi:hypothetical protein